MTDIAQARHELAKGGRLRAALNFGNPLLAHPGTPPSGLTVEIAEELARRLGVGLALVSHDKAADVFAAADSDTWDICFLADDPVRAARLRFTRPYVGLEGCYLLRPAVRAETAEDVARLRLRVATARGSAYTLGLMRVAGEADVQVFENGAAAHAAFVAGEVDCLAGIRQRMAALAAGGGGYRLLEPPFVSIRQAIGTHPDRSAGARFLDSCLADLIASGRLAEMARPHGLEEAIPA